MPIMPSFKMTQYFETARQESLTLAQEQEIIFKRVKRSLEYDAAMKKFPSNKLKDKWRTEVFHFYGVSFDINLVRYEVIIINPWFSLIIFLIHI